MPANLATVIEDQQKQRILLSILATNVKMCHTTAQRSFDSSRTTKVDSEQAPTKEERLLAGKEDETSTYTSSFERRRTTRSRRKITPFQTSTTSSTLSCLEGTLPKVQSPKRLCSTVLPASLSLPNVHLLLLSALLALCMPNVSQCLRVPYRYPHYPLFHKEFLQSSGTSYSNKLSKCDSPSFTTSIFFG